LVQELVGIFGREETAESCLLSLRNELAISSGPPADVLHASVSEMKRGNWATAAAGARPTLRACAENRPRPAFAQFADCLHQLGEYAEAESIALAGLGAQRDLISLKSEPPSEAAIIGRWAQATAPLVSIVCTAYNHERYIDGALRGFLTQQTAFPFEILVHDDASTDGTPSIIRAWQKKYPSLIRPFLQTENQVSRGVRPFELLLRQARGNYVATCEGDDYWLQPTKLQKQVGYLEQHPEFSCAGHSYYLYDERRLSVHRWDYSDRDRVISRRQLMNVSRLFWVPTLVFRKTFSVLPRERDFAAVGDQFLTSYLGTLGEGIYFESFLGSVRRQNQYSMWTPLAAAKKDYIRVKTWLALVRLHERLGNAQAASDLQSRIDASPLDAAQKASLTLQSQALREDLEPVALHG
jgi:hypothetical protein